MNNNDYPAFSRALKPHFYFYNGEWHLLTNSGCRSVIKKAYFVLEQLNERINHG